MTLRYLESTTEARKGVMYSGVRPFDEAAFGVCICRVSDYEPLATRLKKLAEESGMSGDELIEKARDADRDGYAFTTLREMLFGKRSLQLRVNH